MNLTGLTVLGSEEELVSVSGSGEVEGSAACLGGGLECGLGHQECCLPIKTICHSYISCMLCVLFRAFEEQRNHPYNQQLLGSGDVKGVVPSASLA